MKPGVKPPWSPSVCHLIKEIALQTSYLWVLEASRQLLPEHPTGNEVGGAVRRLGAVHDAERDLRAADGGLERGHRLRVREAAEADVVDREEEVALLRERKGGSLAREKRPFTIKSPLVGRSVGWVSLGSRDTAGISGMGEMER